MNQINQPLIYMLSSIYNLMPMKLDGSNYIIWSFQMQNILKSLGLEGFINGSYPCPTGVTTELQEWERNDKALMTYITATLSSEALPVVIGSHNSCEVWNNLRVKYGVRSRSAAMQLQTSLYSIQKGSDTIDKYFQRIKGITYQLASVGIHIPGEELTFIAVNGLPSQYMTIKVMIKAQITTMSVDELLSFLLDEESTMDQSAKPTQFPHTTVPPSLNQGMQWNESSSMLLPYSCPPQLFNNNFGLSSMKNGVTPVKAFSSSPISAITRVGLTSPSTVVAANIGCYPLCQQHGSNYKGNDSQYNSTGFFTQHHVVQQQQNGRNKNFSSQGGDFHSNLGNKELSPLSDVGSGHCASEDPYVSDSTPVNKFDLVMEDYKIKDDQNAHASVPFVDVKVSTPEASSTPATSNPCYVTSTSVTSSPPPKQELKPFDDCDLHGSVLGDPFGSVSAVPTTSDNAAVDLLGSQLSTIVPSTSRTTTSKVDVLLRSTSYARQPILNCRQPSYLKLCHSLPLNSPG